MEPQMPVDTESEFEMKGLTASQRIVKRSFDIVAAAGGLLLTSWLIAGACLIAALDTGKCGLFAQTRIGKNGKLFRLFKLRTMRDIASISTTVTQVNDPRITSVGRFFRRTKLDELPQLMNVLVGHMSLVGPRPDVPGYADRLTGPNRIILTVRPGITGPATLKFRNEEVILAQQADPEEYNRTVIYPEKVRLNREYVEDYSFAKDIDYLVRTFKK